MPETSANPLSRPEPVPVAPASANHLPINANLAFYQKRAKALKKAARAGEPAALRRLSAARGENAESVTPDSVQLSDAQFTVARECGFASWPRLRRHLDAHAPTVVRLRPLTRDIEYYEERAQGLVNAWRGGMAQLAPVFADFLPETAADIETGEAAFEIGEARLLTARQHGCSSWEQLADLVGQLARGETSEPFQQAFEALKTGDETLFAACLDQNPDLVNARGTNGNTLLSLAGDLRREWGVDQLLARGASPNLGNNYGWTSLHSAAYRGNVADARKFLRHGASPLLSARGAGGTPLVVALFWGHDACADFLAETAISPDNLRVAGGLGRLDLLEKLFLPDGELRPEAGEEREFYRPHGGFPDWKPHRDRQEILDEAFSYACRNGRDHILKPLLERGAKVNGTAYFGTGLHWAAWRGSVSTVRRLIELGADINYRANFGGPGHGVNIVPMHLAAQCGRLGVVELLLELGADQTVHDDLYLGTPIGWANFGGHPEVCELLLRQPAVSIMDLVAFDQLDAVERRLTNRPSDAKGDGDTRVAPLHFAKTAAMARLLLRLGADLNPLNAAGRTPLDVAIADQRPEVVAALREFGALHAGDLQTGD